MKKTSTIVEISNFEATLICGAMKTIIDRTKEDGEFVKKFGEELSVSDSYDFIIKIVKRIVAINELEGDKLQNFVLKLYNKYANKSE